jgi:hypothetical protein
MPGLPFLQGIIRPACLSSNKGLSGRRSQTASSHHNFHCLLLIFLCSKRHFEIIGKGSLFVYFPHKNRSWRKWYEYSIKNQDKILRREFRVYSTLCTLSLSSLVSASLNGFYLMLVLYVVCMMYYYRLSINRRAHHSIFSR